MKKTLLSLIVVRFAARPDSSRHKRSQAPETMSSFTSSLIATWVGAQKRLFSVRRFTTKTNKQKIGTITDLIVAPDTSVAFVVIGAGGFVGLGRHNVAVRTTELTSDGDRFVLPGATKESLKAAPRTRYPKRGRS